MNIRQISGGVNYSRAYWYAAGRLDEQGFDQATRDELRDFELNFGLQYERLREDYDATGLNGCPSLKHAWDLYKSSKGNLVEAWAAENKRRGL